MPSEEIDGLPADLAALGEQLSDDAARLAACYPARSARAPAAPPARWPARRWTAAAALLLVGGATGWIIGRATQLGDADHRVALSEAPSRSASHALPLADRSSSAANNAQPMQVIPESPAVDRGERSHAVPTGPNSAAGPVGRPAVDAHSQLASVRPPGLAHGLDQAGDADEAPSRPPRDEAALLRTQIDAFTQVIERLQAELARRDEAQRETNKLIQSLTDEVSRLREQLDSQSPSEGERQ